MVEEMSDGCIHLTLGSGCVKGLALLFQKALDGSIWTGRLKNEPRFYRSFIVRSEEVRRAFEWHDNLSVSVAASLRGLNAMLVHAALKQGLIKQEMLLEFHSGQKQVALPRAEVENLKANYVGLCELVGIPE